MSVKPELTKKNGKRRIAVFAVFIFFLILSILFFLSFSVFNTRGFLHADNNKGNSTGTGIPAYQYEKQKDIPPYHIFAFGESIADIAEQYGVMWSEIVRFNEIVDMGDLRAGDCIFLPPGIKQLKNISYSDEIYTNPTRLPGIITIKSSCTRGSLPLTVRFCSHFDFSDSLFPVWDFGNGRYSLEKEPEFTYLKSGNYQVVLSLADKTGKEVFSNTLLIRVTPLHIASDDDRFFTLNHVGDTLDLTNQFYDEAGLPVVFDSRFTLHQDPPLLSFTKAGRFLAVAPGYTRVILASGQSFYSFFLFVSPFPSRHSVEPEYNWYKTQFDTGMYGNCGPACVAMAVHWATGSNISVEESREEIGLPIKSGAVAYHHMASNFRYHRIKTSYTRIHGFDDVKNIIDKGHIAIILFDTTYIQPVRGDETRVFVDRYYPDTTGHYIVIKGYSLDKKYFIVYDPIPGDWQTNSGRYSDGVSMIGRNRYFLVDQIFRSIKGKDILEIERKHQ
jgi:PKD repeat protein